MTDVRERTAFITGGANGIGLGIARSLARKGVRLALTDIDASGLSVAKAELETITSVEAFVLDVRDRDAYARVADAAEEALGPVSLLFNNAGIVVSGPAEGLTYALWDWSLGINLVGVINGIQTFLPRIVERGGGGHIVNTASGAGLAATSSGVLYCTAKFSVVGMSEALNAELAPSGIGVTVVCPGLVNTEIHRRSNENAPLEGLRMTDEQAKRKADRNALVGAYLKQAIGIDVVGEMVLQGVSEDRLYVHTDRLMEEPVRARGAALLAALPAA